MSQAVITKAFAEWKAQQAINNQPVTLDEFILLIFRGWMLTSRLIILKQRQRKIK